MSKRYRIHYIYHQEAIFETDSLEQFRDMLDFYQNAGGYEVLTTETVDDDDEDAELLKTKNKPR